VDWAYVQVSLDTTGKGTEYQLCAEVDHVTLPTGYYFGVSASTGGLADDHDLLGLDAYQLYGSKDERPAVRQSHTEWETATA
jgi:lectin, mannose-binding 1